MRRLLLCLAGGVALAAGTGDSGDVEESVAPAARILEQAFENLYGCDTTSELELIVRNRGGDERRRKFETVTKRIEGRTYSIGKMTWPPDLRGMAVVTIEAEGRSHDAFVYFPSSRMVRRITVAQRGTEFLGSDLTYEDFQKQSVEDFVVAAVRPGLVDGEPVQVVDAVPREERAYAVGRFFVARSDSALLEARYFKEGSDRPYRVIRAPRASMVREGGHVLPWVLLVRNEQGGTSTEVRFTKVRVNPVIDERVFSLGTLDRMGRLLGPEPEAPLGGRE